MDWSRNWPPELVDPLGPRVHRARMADREVVVKRGPSVRDEADGLVRLARVVGGPRVPDVLHCDDDLLVLEWIESGERTADAEAALGQALAALHGAPAGGWGGGSAWIGECQVDPSPQITAADFYGLRLTDLAHRCGLTDVVGRVVSRLPSLIPGGEPAVLHGDLWWGNVLWAAGGAPALIDPSVHGGHPEEDLAMLALFGSVPGRLLGAYQEVLPLDDGWEERVGLWQLYPLLVHTVLFGGGYRASAEAAARRYA